MKSEKEIAIGIMFVLAVLMPMIFVGTASAAFYPDGYMGTVIEKDTENNTFEVQTEYEWWNDEWQANSTTLKWIFPNENAMNEINVGDYVEILGFPEPSGWTIGLEKMKSSAEKVITDIYGDPYFLEPYSFSSFPENPYPPLLGNYKIEYNNTPDCSNCDVCNCEAKYTYITITNESGQVEVDNYQLYPGQNYVHEGGTYRVNITFLSGQASAYPECTEEPCFGPQPISDFTIHIEARCPYCAELVLLGQLNIFPYDFYEMYYNYVDNATGHDEQKWCHLDVDNDDIWITRFSPTSPGFYPCKAALMGPEIGLDTNEWYDGATSVETKIGGHTILTHTYPELEIDSVDQIRNIPLIGDDEELVDLIGELLAAGEFSIKLDGIYAQGPINYNAGENRAEISTRYGGSAIGPGVSEGLNCPGSFIKYYDMDTEVFGDTLPDQQGCSVGLGVVSTKILQYHIYQL